MTTEKLKAFAICAAIALALLPATMKAQNDTFFRSSFGDNIDNRDIDITFGLMNDPFGEAPSPYGFGPSQGDPLPLGSGLLIMLTAGAGYAIARSKRSLKKTSALLMACLMTLTFTQCGKKLQTITIPQNEVSHSCGYCSSKACSDFTYLDCLLCKSFVTTIDRLPYFYEQLKQIDSKLPLAKCPHDREDLVNIKRLLLYYIDKITTAKGAS